MSFDVNIRDMGSSICESEDSELVKCLLELRVPMRSDYEVGSNVSLMTPVRSDEKDVCMNEFVQGTISMNEFVQ